jgi:hypothetical protein
MGESTAPWYGFPAYYSLLTAYWPMYKEVFSDFTGTIYIEPQILSIRNCL